MNIQLSNINRQQFVALVADPSLAGQVFDSIEALVLGNARELTYEHLKKVCREAVIGMYPCTYKDGDKIKSIKMVRAIVLGYAGEEHPLFNLADAKRFVEDLKPNAY